jgi:2-iminoacetate synthase ThiH
MVLVESVWLRKAGDKIQVLVNLGGDDWRIVIEEPEGIFHNTIASTFAINRSPKDNMKLRVLDE